jgi:hypothetical protein
VTSWLCGEEYHEKYRDQFDEFLIERRGGGRRVVRSHRGYDYSMRQCCFALLMLLASGSIAAAQNPPVSSRAPEPALRRWFEFQQFVLGTRYRFIRNSADVTTSNHMQYREQIRTRLNLDAKKRYTVNAGFYSGSQFTGSWDDLGPGTGGFDGHHHFMRQLYFSAIPVGGIEAQAGGIYVIRGESTEYTSYDEDGYVVGGRFSIRRPKSLYFDEVSVTRGTISQTTVPNLWKRWEDADDPNYTQVLVDKRFSPLLSASLDYTNYAKTDTLRGAIAIRFKPNPALSAIRYEQYVRTSDPDSASGFSLMAERPITRWVRLQGGYATIDEHYGGLNADRIQRGRRFFAAANVPIWGPLSGSLFVTHALDASYSISNKTRLDAVLAWDVLSSLRKTGVF